MVKSKVDDNIFRYLKWRSDLTFEQDKFNEVDGLIISELTFLELMIDEVKDAKPLKEALAPYLDRNKDKKINLGFMIPEDCLKLAPLLSKSKRFENGIISNFEKIYNEKTVEQFCALTYHVSDELMVVAFQGTDDTLIGWEENFDMISVFPVPAQIAAKSYVDKLHELYPNKDIITVGHSKGGNLSVYSGLYAEQGTKEKIIKIYNYDGPGFEAGDVSDEIINESAQKVINIVPYHASVSMIFNTIGKIKSVKSNERGLLQHNGFSWIVEGKKFVRTPLSNDSINFNKALNEFFIEIDEDTRKELLSAFNDYVESLNTKTLVELSKSGLKAIASYNKLPKRQKQLIMRFIQIFIKHNMV